jgi:hypothetical protein
LFHNETESSTAIPETPMIATTMAISMAAAPMATMATVTIRVTAMKIV